MKNIINTYTTSLLILLSVTHLPQVQATEHQQQESWHKFLVRLYYKGAKKNIRDVQETIGLFKNACQNIQAIYEINKSNIKPKMLKKSKLSQKSYDLDILKVYYLLTKKNKGEHLIPDQINIGNKAIQNLYYKGSSLSQDKKKSMQEILNSVEDTKKRSNTDELDYRYCAVQLAELLNKNKSSYPGHSYQGTNNSGLETTKIHKDISQLKINVDFQRSNNKTTLSSPLISDNNGRTPECSSDEATRRIVVKEFNKNNPEILKKQLRKKNAFSANDVNNLPTFEQNPEELLNKYQQSIQLNIEQSEDLTKLQNTKKEHTKKIQSLDKQLLKLQQELSETKNNKKKQHEKSHALQYTIAIITGCIIGIAIDQAIHKIQANTEKKEESKE